jgi:hypothetical protein
MIKDTVTIPAAIIASMSRTVRVLERGLLAGSHFEPDRCARQCMHTLAATGMHAKHKGHSKSLIQHFRLVSYM